MILDTFKRWAGNAFGLGQTGHPMGRSGRFVRNWSTIRAAAETNYSTDWRGIHTSVNSDIAATLRAVRGRSRELYYNDPLARRYFDLIKTNLVGHTGITMQSRWQTVRGKQLDSDNALIEASWKRWGHPGHCDVTGRLSLKDLLCLIVECVARDGDVAVRLVRGYPNAWGFAVQVLEADVLDALYNDQRPDGNLVRMGVETDRWGRPVAYWINTRHPGDNYMANPVAGFNRVRIPASEMILPFISFRPQQLRGYPWMHAAMPRLNQLRGYAEAELDAARTGACNTDYYKPKDPDEINTEGWQQLAAEEIEANGRLEEEAEPGQRVVLPFWVDDVKSVAVQHPSGNYDPFTKSAKKDVASGLPGAAYHSLSGDLTEVNFSSIRSGTLEQRDTWRMLQQWLIDAVLNPIYAAWLEMALLTDLSELSIPPGQGNAPLVQWYARSWEWVDPVKDREANLLAIQSGEKTIYDVQREAGHDPETVLAEMQRSYDDFKARGMEDVWKLIYGLKKETPANATRQSGNDTANTDGSRAD